MDSHVDGEQFLLRNQVSNVLGYYSQIYNSVLIPADVFEQAGGQLMATLAHEKMHWAQFNLSPWGQFLLHIYETYIGLSEEILVRTKTSAGRIDKPLWIFLQQGTRRENDEILNRMCEDHNTALDALPAIFNGSDAVSSQALVDAFGDLRRFALTPGPNSCSVSAPHLAVSDPSAITGHTSAPTWRSLVETWAKSIEILYSVRGGYGDYDRRGELLDRIMRDEYGALFPVFLRLAGFSGSRINEIQTYAMLAACAVAMQSPAHPAFSRFWSGSMDWSDLRPETRFVKAASALQTIGWPDDLTPNAPRQHETAIAELMDRICDHLGWPRAGELADAFADQSANSELRPSAYHNGFLLAAPLISQDPSLLALGPCHSSWEDFEIRIGSVPVFIDPLLSKRVPGPAMQNDLDPQAHAQILNGVKFNLYNEIFYEDSFNKLQMEAFKHGDWVEDRAARAVADSLFISPVFDELEKRDVYVKDIFQWDLYTMGPEGQKTPVLVKSAMREKFGAAFDREPVPWQLSVNGRSLNV